MNTTSPNPVYRVLLSSKAVNAQGDGNTFQLQPLPYAQDALAPCISERTVQFHYGKHLAGYIDNTNKQKKGTEFENMTVEDILLHADGGLFNNAAQVYNHYFYFESLQSPREAENGPCERVMEAIGKDFGSFAVFKERFAQAAVGLFGSGYAWLAVNPQENKLEIMQTRNAENPLKEGKIPLLNIDVWEHAYYLDVQNLRAKYVENFWKIVNWTAVEQRWKCL